MKQVIGKDGRMMKNTGKYQGMTTAEARRSIVSDMKKMGLIDHIEENYLHNVARCYRCGSVIEPLPSRQWFIKMKGLSKGAKKAVESGKIKIIPKFFEKIYYHWLDNIRDWCISRQLWWGHRLPVWYCQTGKIQNAKSKAQNKCKNFVVSEEKPKKCPKCGGTEFRQDSDVLDTWFSSALWPLSTLGWPNEKSADFKKFYPTQVMETGYDILFFWVARMIIFGLEFSGKIPFETVYLHGLVRDERGRKMSKSLGNVLDPIDIARKYGADALRFSMVVGATAGKDINLSLQKIEGNRNFMNKIWNASRFVIMNLDSLDGSELDEVRPKREELDKRQRKVIKEFTGFQRQINGHLEKFHFSLAGEALRDFFWHKFCDVYLEEEKKKINQGGKRARISQRYLLYLLTQQLKMLHPFIPFLTEEIWQRIWKSLNLKKKPLIISSW